MRGSISASPMPMMREFQSVDPAEVQDHVSRSLSRHRMDLARSAPIAARLTCFDISDAQIVDIQYGAHVRIEADQPRDHYLVHASLNGTSAFASNGTRDWIDDETIHITCPDVPTRFEMTDRCRHLTLRMPETAFAEQLAEMGIPVTKPLVFERGGGRRDGFARMWRQTLEQLTLQIATVPQMMAAGRVQRRYVALLVELILTNYRSNYSDKIDLYGNTVCPWHVKRARDIIHAGVADTISIPALAAQIGVSARSLQNGFRQFLGMTPVEYVRHHRLEQLHAALIGTGPQASVTELMLDCGITNFGRYAQYYRQYYGCRPSETVRASARGRALAS